MPEESASPSPSSCSRHRQSSGKPKTCSDIKLSGQSFIGNRLHKCKLAPGIGDSKWGINLQDREQFATWVLYRWCKDGGRDVFDAAAIGPDQKHNIYWVQEWRDCGWIRGNSEIQSDWYSEILRVENRCLKRVPVHGKGVTCSGIRPISINKQVLAVNHSHELHCC